LTNIRVQIVSGLRLVRQREIVSWLPEKICSTATADPDWSAGEKETLLEW
jgi:hypothetical protein